MLYETRSEELINPCSRKALSEVVPSSLDVVNHLPASSIFVKVRYQLVSSGVKLRDCPLFQNARPCPLELCRSIFASPTL